VTMRTLIANAEVDGRYVSVGIDGERITLLTDDQTSIADEFDDCVDAAGGALLPGLHDHHVHLLAMAARRNGVDVDHLDTAGGFDDELRKAVERNDGDWVRVTGYDDYRHGPLDRGRLDEIVGDIRLRVKHRSGLAWVLSSAGLDEVLGNNLDDDLPEGIEKAVDGRLTGRLLRLDEWLADRIGVTAPSLAGLGTDLAAFGLTGVTDATPALGAGRTEVLRRAVVDGVIPQRIVLLGVEESDIVATSEDCSPWARVGPAKIVIDEVIGLDPDALADLIAMHHGNGRAVAIHAVSRAETVTTVTAFAIAGIRDGDRIEHGSVLPMELDPLLSHSGLTVVVQPGLVVERGDFYRDAVEPTDSAILHRAASLLDAGIAVAVGSDAPVTSIDPWATIAAASTRRTRSGHVLGESEKVSALTALNWYLTDPLVPGGPVRNLRVGSVADLCLLDVSLAHALSAPDARHVRRTWVGGRLVHS